MKIGERYRAFGMFGQYGLVDWSIHGVALWQGRYAVDRARRLHDRPLPQEQVAADFQELLPQYKAVATKLGMTIPENTDEPFSGHVSTRSNACRLPKRRQQPGEDGIRITYTQNGPVSVTGEIGTEMYVDSGDRIVRLQQSQSGAYEISSIGTSSTNGRYFGFRNRGINTPMAVKDARAQLVMLQRA